MDFIAKNYMAIAAIITALVALLGVWLQYHRDEADEMTKRVDAASKIVQAAINLTNPLENRVNELEKDSEILKEIVRRQSKSYDDLMDKYDKVLYELRAVRADRDNLLSERLLYQKRVDEQAKTISELKLRIEGLERELALLRNSKAGTT